MPDTWLYERLVRLLDECAEAGSCEDAEQVIQAAVSEITGHVYVHDFRPLTGDLEGF